MTIHNNNDVINDVENALKNYKKNMIKNFTVTKKAIRPERERDRCFYCNQPIGAKHDENCILIRKIVKIGIVGYIKISLPFSMNNIDTCDEVIHVIDDAETIIDINLNESLNHEFVRCKIMGFDQETEDFAVLEEDRYEELNED